MPVYVVAYDLNQETRRPNIVAEVRRSSGWAKLSESSYAIETIETVTQVHERFSKYLDRNDSFYVISLSRPWTGYGDRHVMEWLGTALGPGSQNALHGAPVPPRPRPLTAPKRTPR